MPTGLQSSKLTISSNKKLTELVEKIESRITHPKPSVKQAEILPLWFDEDRAIPNHLARSSLFAPIARNKRELMDGVKIASRKDVKIYFSGKQLDEADCDVWMHTLHLIRMLPVGVDVEINRASFLRDLGRSKGTSGYVWLHKAFERLAFAMVTIETDKYKIGGTVETEVFHLIQSFHHKPREDSYRVSLDPRIHKLFSNKEFSLIDWQKRMQICRRTDMAKYMQRLIATDRAAIQRYALVDIKERMVYESPMNKFKEAISEALEELVRVGIITSSKFEESTRGREQVKLVRSGGVA